MEPVIGNGGVIFPPDNKYFEIIADICHKNDMYLIVDEAQCFPGRLGTWFASQAYDIPADILVLGKGLGGGMPIGAMLPRDEILKRAKTGPHGTLKNDQIYFSGTFSRDPLIAAAATAVIEYIDKNNLVERAAKSGKYIQDRLKKLQQKYEVIGDVRGMGFSFGVEFVKDRKTKEPFPSFVAKLTERALKKGVYMHTGGVGQVLKIRPPLTIPKKQIDKIISVIEESIKEGVRGIKRK